VKAVLVFLAMFALDFIWARYTAAMVDKRPHLASVYAVGIVATNGVVVVSYTSDPWMLLPAALGAYAGTWAAVRWGKA
jgi:hypothetical protein